MPGGEKVVLESVWKEECRTELWSCVAHVALEGKPGHAVREEEGEGSSVLESC